MKNLFAVVVATTSLLVTGVAWAQSGSMMNGGMGMGGWMGGNGGYWMPILLVVVVALVVWVIIRRRK
jgi:Spy/CpxP family protein refolding chaperone